MSKITHNTEPRELRMDELDLIAGGMPSLQGAEGAREEQNTPAQVFAQILQQLTGG